MAANPNQGCLAADLFPASGLKYGLGSILYRDTDPCWQLLKKAASMLVAKQDAQVGSETNSRALDTAINNIYCYLLFLHENGSDTLAKALLTPRSLMWDYIYWRKNRGTLKPLKNRDALTNDAHDVPLHKQRLAYYRKQIIDSLNSDNKITKGKDEYKRDIIYFWFQTPNVPNKKSAEKLPVFADFTTHKQRIAFMLAPEVHDEDFWMGEENEGRKDGPSKSSLRGLCEKMFMLVATIKGHEYLCAINDLCDLLPLVYTYFAIPNGISISADRDDDDDRVCSYVDPPVVNNRSLYDQAARFAARNRSAIIACAAVMGTNQRRLLALSHSGLKLDAIKRLTGQKSAGRIEEKIQKAVKDLCLMLKASSLWPEPVLPKTECPKPLLPEADLPDRDDEVALFNNEYLASLLPPLLEAWRSEDEEFFRKVDDEINSD